MHLKTRFCLNRMTAVLYSRVVSFEHLTRYSNFEANPWLCDSRLEWFRQLLRDNLDIDIDKPGCVAACMSSVNNCPPEGTPLRALDFCPISDNPLPLVSSYVFQEL